MITTTMKAVVSTAYGPPEVLRFLDVEKPEPKANEILVHIHASTVTAGDCEMRRFEIPRLIWLPLRLYMGIFKPRINILGQELAGEVEAVGNAVTQFKKGDAVFAPTEMSLGAHAECICLPASYAIAHKPAPMSFREAATLPTGGLNALHFIRKAAIRPGQKVLINGAGGCIGTYTVQMAKSLGAEVTAVDSTRKLVVLHSIGADHVIDYTQEDFGKSGKKYDVIIDIVGKRSFSRCLKALDSKGTCIMGNPRLRAMLLGMWVSLTTGKKVKPALADYKTEDLVYLAELYETGVIKPVIDRSYPLGDMAEAHRYVETGQKTGNVVITMV